MERILVIGATGGIGSALCAALGARGCEVIPRSRSVDDLDVTDEASVIHGLEAIGDLDGVIVTNGANTRGQHRKNTARIAPQQAVCMFQYQGRANGIPRELIRHRLGR